MSNTPIPVEFQILQKVACILGALWAERGKRGILGEARNRGEVRDKGRTKIDK